MTFMVEVFDHKSCKWEDLSHQSSAAGTEINSSWKCNQSFAQDVSAVKYVKPCEEEERNSVQFVKRLLVPWESC